MLSLIVLTAFGFTCQKADDSVTGSALEATKPAAAGRCGDRVLEGTLLSAASCPSQATPGLPDYRSQDGLTCNLDVYVSCDSEPVTSRCFLQDLGLQETDAGKYPSAAIIGALKSVNVCKLNPACQSKTSGCLDCKQQTIFVACGLDGSGN